MMDPSRMAFSAGRGMAMRPFDAAAYPPGAAPFVHTPPAAYAHHQQQQQQQQQGSPLGSSGRGSTGTGQGPMTQPGFYPPMPSPEAAYMAGYYAMQGPAPPGGGAVAGVGGYPGGPGNPGAYPGPMFGRGRGQYFPGGRNWAGARPPPPGQPGFSSGLQVVVHNLPWDCTWQQLRDAFQDCGEIERADVVFDSRGRSRGFGIVRFPDRESAELAAEKMNNGTIGGRVVSVRLDRFA
jgi:RNA recognition motif. (a.k.a. RRM, RBD, or RNP domain)